jgi:hypothetical protein
MGKPVEKTPAERLKEFREKLLPYETSTLFVALFERLLQKGYDVADCSGAGQRVLRCQGEDAVLNPFSIGESMSVTGISIPVASLRKSWFREAFKELYDEANPGGDFYHALLWDVMDLPSRKDYLITVEFEHVVDEGEISKMHDMMYALRTCGERRAKEYVLRFLDERVGPDFRFDNPYLLRLLPTNGNAMEAMVFETSLYKTALSNARDAVKQLLEKEPDAIRKELKGTVFNMSSTGRME